MAYAPLRTNYNAGGPPQYRPNYTTKDPREMATQDRTVIADRGNRIDQDLTDETLYRSDLEGYYRPKMDEAYGELRDTPGYTEQEAQNIVRQPQYEGLQAGDQQLAGVGPTGQERAAMLGDPNYYGWFDPARLDATDRESAQRQRDVAGEARGRMDGNIGQLEQRYGDAVTGLGQEQDAALSATESSVRDAQDPSRLRMSDDFVNRYRMTDEDVQGRANEGATDVQNRYQTAIGELQRNAAASGNAGPLAVGAARARLEQQSAGDAADARLRQLNQARAEQAGREKDVEQIRLGSEGDYAGLRTGTEMELGGRRVSAAQGYTDRQMEAIRDIGDQAMAANRYAGDLQMGAESRIGSQSQDTGRYIGDTGTGIRRENEQVGAARATQDYGNRRDAAQYGIETKYGQGVGVQDRLSAGSQNVADARRTGQQEYRGYTTGQTDAAQAGQAQARGQRIDNYGTQAGGQNTATRGAQSYDIARREQPGTLGKIIGVGVGAAKGYLTGGPAGAAKGGLSAYK